MIYKNDICSTDKCTGCLACYNICPYNAIKLDYDGLGFCHPFISENCKECGLCKKICPVVNLVKKNMPQRCLAAMSNIHLSVEPTSGGIASLLYKYFIACGGIGYGVLLDNESGRFRFCRAEQKGDIERFTGSKYIQADMGEAYREVKKDLLEDKQVVFIGTPCQIAGLKSFLRKEYDNLLVVDIICHGTPSQKMLFDSIRIDKTDKINSIQFRRGKEYILKYSINNERVHEIDSYRSKFYEAFSLGKSIRKSCHECDYASIQRVGDITIGDFWGLGSDSSLYKKQIQSGGISLVFINSKKGEQIFDSINDNLIWENREIQEAVAGNTQLRFPVSDTKEAKKFRNIYGETGDFVQAVRKSRNFRQFLSSIYIVHEVATHVRHFKD